MRAAAAVAPRTVPANAHCRRTLRGAHTTTHAYGTSDPTGTWTEKPQNAFGALITMAKGQREVVQAGTPALRNVAREVDPSRIDSGEIQELIAEMTSVCRARGVGLAAPQLGTQLRVIVLEDTTEGMSDVSPGDRAAQRREPFPMKVIINPVLSPVGDASAAFYEGCLSVGGYRAVVRRHLRVKCRGLAGDGSVVDFEASGWMARILQHEVDHLNGVLYTDRMESRTFRRVDKINEPLPPDHPEFGPTVVLGESSIAPKSSAAAPLSADDLENRAKMGRRRKR